MMEAKETILNSETVLQLKTKSVNKFPLQFWDYPIFIRDLVSL